MPRAAALGIAVAALVAVHGASANGPSASASPTSHNPRTFTDPTGDSAGAPDISSVLVGNTRAGIIRFEISIANAPPLLRDVDFVGAFIDADRSESTGPLGGFEYTIQFAGGIPGQLVFGRWNGSTYVPTPAPSLVMVWASPKLTLRVSSADLGNTTSFTFWAATEVLPASGDFDDVAPDGDAVYEYTLSTPHIASVRARFTPAAPRAGRRFRVSGVTVRLETAEELAATSFRCRARLGTKALRGSGAGGCAFSLPRNAKGKRLSIAITATLENESKTITSSFRVR